MVKNLLAMQETGPQSLGQEDPLEKGMATHSSVLAWRIPWTEELSGVTRVRHNLGTEVHHHHHFHYKTGLSPGSYTNSFLAFPDHLAHYLLTPIALTLALVFL